MSNASTCDIRSDMVIFIKCLEPIPLWIGKVYCAMLKSQGGVLVRSSTSPISSFGTFNNVPPDPSTFLYVIAKCSRF